MDERANQVERTTITERRVPLTDERHQATAILVVRGPWAELLGPGASIRIYRR